VKANQATLANRAGRFQTTQWSVVLLSAQSQALGSQEALAELCRAYWYPLYGFIRHRGHNPEEARDLTQGFFLHLLEGKALTRANPQKGKFRSFLLGSLQKFLASQSAREHCLKRGGHFEFVSTDVQDAEGCYQLESVDPLTPEKMFDARWAKALLGQAMSRLQQEYAARGKSSTFETLKAFLEVADSKEAPPYEQVTGVLQISVGNVKALIHRLRKRYTSLVREEITRTVSDSADIDGEIHGLCEALIAAEGHIKP
jgi:DNA-directed RNA polymerase specialized sigma24 family protein